MDEWEKLNPAIAPMKFIQSEFLIENPKHKRIGEIAEEKKRNARISIGLSPKSSDINEAKLPSLQYIENPPNKTRQKFLENLREENVS